MPSGLDARQLLEFVIRPTLKKLGEQYATRAAERLVLGTAAVESGLVALRQYRGGPAVGLYQMEPATYWDHWQHTLAFPRTLLRDLVLGFGSRGANGVPPPEEMVWNLALATAMCRVHYLRNSDPLPRADDVQGMADYWKLTYNSRLGAGKPDDFIRAWQRIVSPILT